MVRRAQNGTRIPDPGRLTVADWSLYATRGFSLFPLGTNSKRPAIDTWEEYQTQRADAALVEAWSRSDLNTGVATGAVSNCFVLDLDDLPAWGEAVARGLPETFVVKTPRGWHYYFQHPGFAVTNRAGPRWTGGVIGWDIRGDGGYVVGPGSTYVPTPDDAAKGKIAGCYTIESDAPVAPAPAWLLEMLATRVVEVPPAPLREAETTSVYGLRALHAELTILADAGHGHLNDQINISTFAIAQLVAGGEIREDDARGALFETLAAHGVADEQKANGTFDRAWAAGFTHPRAAPPAPSPLDLFGSRANAPLSSGAAPPPPADEPWPITIAPHQLAEYFKGCVYVGAHDKIFYRGLMLGKSAFDTYFGRHDFYTRHVETTKLCATPWDAFRMNHLFEPPIADDLCFRPECEPGAIIKVGSRSLLNTYVPEPVRRVRGDITPWLDFMARFLPVERDRRILTSYGAALVQNPGAKFQWWPVLQGAEGNGKSAVLRAFSYTVGERYTHLVNPEAMAKTGNQFNAWIQGTLFLGIEEIHMAGRRDFLDSFKPVVTNDRIGLEGKGTPQTTGDNRLNGLLCTNHRDAIPVTVDGRRYAVFFTGQQSAADIERDFPGDYFARFYEWLRADGYAIVAEYLHTLEPDVEFNPAGNCQRAPRTSSTAAALGEAHGHLEQEVLEAIDSEQHGFRGGIISSVALSRLFDRLRVKIGPNRYQGMMASLGYTYHPALRNGRSTVRFADGSKPRFYFTADHPALQLTDSAAIAKAYDDAQQIEETVNNVVSFPRR